MSAPAPLTASFGAHPCLGDTVCLASAAIHLIRNLSLEVALYAEKFSRLLRAYAEPGLIALDRDPGLPSIVLRVHPFHRTRHNLNGHNNFVGAYVAALGFSFAGHPAVVCPDLEPVHERFGLEDRGYCLLQPYARTLGRHDLSPGQLQGLVDLVRAEFDLPVVVGGKEDTPRDLAGVHYALGDVEVFLPLIARAKFVLGPESAAAHIAAGYRVPAVVWHSPERDDFMWLFSYPEWVRRLCHNDPGSVGQALAVMRPILGAQDRIRAALRALGRADLLPRAAGFIQGDEAGFIDRLLAEGGEA